MKNNLNLKIKVLTPLIVIFFIIFILSSYVSVQRESQFIEDKIISSSKSFSYLSVSEVIINYELYYHSGFSKFSEIISNLLNFNKDIIKIQIYYATGQLLFDSDEITNGKYFNNVYNNISNENLLNAIGNIEQTTFKSEEFNNSFEIIQPYIDKWGGHIYSVRYIYSLSRLNQLQQNLILNIIIYSMLFLLISFFSIYILIGYYVTKPIKKLIDGVRKILKGKLGEKIKINSKDEIGELASSFNEMTVDLKKSNQKIKEYSKNLEKLVIQKNQLLIQLSHDLKNPLGPITNSILLLKNMENDSSKVELLDILQRNFDYMKNLIVKTIEYIKVNSPELPLKYNKIKLIDIIEKLITIKKPLIEKKNLSYDINIEDVIYIWTDQLYFEELFTNILENSIKYNKKNGKIYIKAIKKGKFIQISLSDEGIGLEKSEIKQVFNEFYKADKARQDFESSGLGLTISKKIVELHGGKIWIESKGKNKGITVYFTIPYV